MTNHEGAHIGATRPDAAPLSEIWTTLELCGTGLYTNQVACRLGVDHDTVRQRVERARDLLGAGSKLETVVRAFQLGLIAPPPLQPEHAECGARGPMKRMRACE
jgi:DNA-binding NarL/FixJ family response regulator